MKPTALVAAAAAVAVLATACSGGGDKTVATTQTPTSAAATTTAPSDVSTTTATAAAPKPTTVTIQPLFVRSGGGGPASGGVGKEVVTRAPSDDGSLPRRLLRGRGRRPRRPEPGGVVERRSRSPPSSPGLPSRVATASRSPARSTARRPGP